MCNGDLTLKYEYAYLNELNLVKYMFCMEYDNHEWTGLILSRVHEEVFWIGDAPVAFGNDLIHMVTSLSNECFNLVNDKNVRQTVERNLYTRFDGRNMKVDMIQDKGVKVLSRLFGYKLNHSSRVNDVTVGFMPATYIMEFEKRMVNLCEIVRTQLLDNIAKFKKNKNAVCIYLNIC